MAEELDRPSFNTSVNWDEYFFNLGSTFFEDIPGSQLASEAFFCLNSPGSMHQRGLLAAYPTPQSMQEVTLDYYSASHRSTYLPSSLEPQIITPVDNTPPIHMDSPGMIPVLPSPILEPNVSNLPEWLKIPQGTYSRKRWDFKASAPILFHVDGYPGINLSHALNKKIAALEGWDDLVLQNAKGAISCRLLFPGYPPNISSQISTKYWTKQRDPITRGKLAYEVARKVKQYLDKMSTSHDMDKSVDARWRIGHGFMRLEHMYLARLVSVSKGSYQPEIWIVDSTV